MTSGCTRHGLVGLTPIQLTLQATTLNPVLVTHPYRCGQFRRVPYEPCVATLAGGTRLAVSVRHARYSSSGPVLDHFLKSVIHLLDCLCLQSRVLRLGLRLLNDVTVWRVHFPDNVRDWSLAFVREC